MLYVQYYYVFLDFPDNPAAHDKYTDSCFIEEFILIMEVYAHLTHLYDIITKVNTKHFGSLGTGFNLVLEILTVFHY